MTMYYDFVLLQCHQDSNSIKFYQIIGIFVEC